MNENREFFGLSVRAWLIIFILVFLVRAPFLFYFGFSVDAYLNVGHLPSYAFLAGQGRPGSFLLFELFRGLGLYGPIPQYVDVLLALPLLCIAAVLLWSTLFKVQRRSVLPVMAGAVLFLVHPYNAEILTFRDAAPIYALSTLLGVGGYYLYLIRGRFIEAVLLVTFALSIYQTFINFLAIVWLLSVLVSRIGPRRLESAFRDDLRKIEGKGFALIVVSLATYLVVLKLLNWITGTQQDGRATLIAFSEIPERLRQVLMVVRGYLAGDLIASADLASAATVFLWVAGFGLCLIDGSRRMRFIVVPAIFALSCLASIGVILVGRDFGPVPRVLVGFALLPAFGASYSLLYLSERYKKVVYAMLGLLLLSYAGVGATIAADQVRVNQRDRVIASVLEARMPLAAGQHIAIVRGPEAWHGLSTQRSYMNMSAYWTSWSNVNALSEFYGYPVQAADQAEYARAQAYCKTAPIWPAKESTHVLDGGLAVVCMSRPPE